MAKEGFIVDHRKELDSDIWLMPPMYHRVWQWLKYNVNHTDIAIPLEDGTRMTIKKGQKLTSIRHICQGVGYYEQKKWTEPNPKTISSILQWLTKNKMISVVNGNKRYTLITLENWEKYQYKNFNGNAEETSREQRSNKHGTKKKQATETNNNVLTMKNNEEQCYNNEEVNISTLPTEQSAKYDKVPYKEIIDYLNMKTGSSYKYTTKATQALIKARFNDKATVEDFYKCIDNMTTKWLNDSKMRAYLRPETLFGTKFESYVNAVVDITNKFESNGNKAIAAFLAKHKGEGE